MRGFLRRRLWEPLMALLRQGVTADKLAWSVALGVVLGLVPVLGVSTAACALAALTFRLNLPAIQLVNYLVTPLQLLLIIPQLRFGEWLAHAPPFPVTLESGLALLARGAFDAVRVLATAIGHATLGWAVLALPAALILQRAFALALRRRIPLEVTP
jgi:uncharacterized protein (DUF2062 family)